MSVKLELSDDEARSLRDRWEQELIQHQGAADELAKKIAAIDTQLTGQISLLEPETKSGKRKKGENLHTLRSYLEALGMRGATVAHIHKATGIPVSSCNAVLKRHDEIFARDRDGFWRIKRDAQK